MYENFCMLYSIPTALMDKPIFKQWTRGAFTIMECTLLYKMLQKKWIWGKLCEEDENNLQVISVYLGKEYKTRPLSLYTLYAMHCVYYMPPNHNCCLIRLSNYYHKRPGM